MKNLIALATLLFCISSNASTWTIHGFRDNYTGASICGPLLSCTVPPSINVAYWKDGDHLYEYMAYAHLDYDNDLLYPDYAYSGVSAYTNVCDGEYTTEFYPVLLSASWQFTISGDATFADFWLYGPQPDYNGESRGTLPLSGGEFWIDFDSTGIARVSTSEPSDFGKWAWDGSINPNYVEPIAPLKSTRGKHLGKQVK